MDFCEKRIIAHFRLFTNLQVLLLPKQKSLLVLRRDLDVSIVCRFSHNGFGDHICVVLIWSYTVHVLIQDSYFLFIVPASGAKKIKIIKISDMELGLQNLGTILENGFGDHICVVLIWSYTVQDSYFLFIVPASGAKKIKIIDMELGLQNLATI